MLPIGTRPWRIYVPHSNIKPNRGDKNASRQIETNTIVTKNSAVPKRAAQRIRETAGDLFYKQGIRSVGVDEIVLRAGVTKPSLYRAFSSKDELAAIYLRDHSEKKQRLFDEKIAAKPDDPRGQFREWLSELMATATEANYRGCGNTNAILEYSDNAHPARRQAVANKRRFRERMRNLAGKLGAREPQALADGLLLLIEGTYATGQMFGGTGPARALVVSADMLIDAHCK